jgi:sodium/potassium/calcium exchanger 5
VCDKYLVVSLETLCVRWGVREDVAGATFMAFGSAAPEIIINAIGTFTGESDLGVGAIIGSGMIAFSCILGLCALVSGADLMLKRRPLARDSLFYLERYSRLLLSCLTLLGTAISLSSQRLRWLEYF